MNSLTPNHGFTLIEVLIALAIISIALTAIVKVSGQTIRDTRYIQEKNMTAWVARDVMSYIQVGLLKPQSMSDKLVDTVEILGQRFVYQATALPTANSRIHEIQVDVMHEQEDAILSHLTGYLYETSA